MLRSKRLGKIGNEDALLVIKDADSSIRGDSSSSYDSLQGYTSAARTALLKGLNDPDEEMRIKALEICLISVKTVGSSLLTSM